jgi:hypothetical protein
MSTSVYDALLNAQINLENCECMLPGFKNPIYQIAKNQLDNALKAIDNGMSLEDIIQEEMGGEIKTEK